MLFGDVISNDYRECDLTLSDLLSADSIEKKLRDVWSAGFRVTESAFTRLRSCLSAIDFAPLKSVLGKVVLVVVAGGAIAISLATPALAADLGKLDAGGIKILGIIRRIGYWVILVKCIADLVKAGIQGDTHAIGRIIMMYVMIYGALFFVPWALQLVEGIF